MISFMKKFTLTIINILTLSSCGIDRDDYNNAKQQTDNYTKCIKYFILPLIFYLSGCGVLFDEMCIRDRVGSVLMDRMVQEQDFANINPVFFTTSQAGQKAPVFAGKEAGDVYKRQVH